MRPSRPSASHKTLYATMPIAMRPALAARKIACHKVQHQALIR